MSKREAIIELISQDLPPSVIAERLGIKRPYVYNTLSFLRKKYGWQAE